MATIQADGKDALEDSKDDQELIENWQSALMSLYMARDKNFTTIQIKKSTISLLNQMRAEEAGRFGESNITQDQFLVFLLNLYKAVKDDTSTLSSAWKETEAIK